MWVPYCGCFQAPLVVLITLIYRLHRIELLHEHKHLKISLIFYTLNKESRTRLVHAHAAKVIQSYIYKTFILKFQFDNKQFHFESGRNESLMFILNF